MPNRMYVRSAAVWLASGLGRSSLLGFLGLLLLGSWLLYSHIPEPDLHAKIDLGGKHVYWQDPDRTGWHCIKILDPNTGEITSGAQADVNLMKLDARGNSVSFDYVRPAMGAARSTARITDPRTSVSRKIALPPIADRLVLIGGRYAVGATSDGVAAFDLQNPTAAPLRFLCAVGEPAYEIPGSPDHFLFFSRELGRNANRKGVVIFAIKDAALIRIKTIQSKAVSAFGEFMATLSEDERHVDLRRIGDYEIAESIELPPHVPANHEIGDLFGSWLKLEAHDSGDVSYFDVDTRRQVRLPGQESSPVGFTSDLRFYVLRSTFPTSGGSYQIYDVADDRICLTIPRYISQKLYFEGTRLLVCNPSMGVTFVAYDLVTGERKTYAPFLWCAILQTVLLFGWFGWLLMWLVSTARSKPLVVLNFVSAVLVLWAVAYPGYRAFQISLWGATDTSSLIFAFWFGVCLGGILSATAWYGVGQERSRIEWPIVSYGAMAWWQLYRFDNATVMRTIYSNTYVLLMVALAMIAAFVLSWTVRKLGWRFAVASEDGACKEREPISLLDYFSTTAAIAFVVFALRPVWSGEVHFDRLLTRYTLWVPAVSIAAFGGCVLLFITLHPKLLHIATLLAGLLWCLMVYSEFSTFLGPALPSPPKIRVALHVIVATATCVFAIALTCRLRGWTLERIAA